MEDMRSFNANLFPILRYLAIFCVMCLHFTGYMRIYVPDHAVGISVLRSVIDFYQPTVVLFSISGFLISASIDGLGIDNLKLYLKKRFLRLYPELWVSMLFYIICIYCVVPELLDNSIFKWIITQGIGIAATPSCMQEFATGSINGSMWYITVLIQLYILLFIFKLFIKNNNSRYVYGFIFIAFTICNLTAFYINPVLPPIAQKLLERSFVPYAIWFFIGVLFHDLGLYQKRYSILFLIILIMIHFLIKTFKIFDFGYYTGLLSGMAVAAIAILVATFTIKKTYYSRLISFCLKLKKTDISYGMYLNHWLFINLLIHYKIYEKIHWGICFVLYILATIIVAFVGHIITSKLIDKLSSIRIKMRYS